MTSRELGNVAIKVLGIYILLLAIQYIPIIVVSLIELKNSPGADFNTPVFLASQVLALSLYLGIGLWLFARSEYLSTKLFKNSSVSVARFTPKMLQTILFSTVGILILANSVTELAKIVHRAATIHQTVQNYFLELFWHQNLESIVTLAIKLPLGLYLFLGSEGIARMWRRLRPMAYKPED